MSNVVMRDEMTGKQQAKSSSASCDEDSALGVQGTWDGEDELANVASLGDEAEGLASFSDIPAGDGRESQGTAIEETEHFVQHVLDAVGASLAEVESSVRDAGVSGREVGWVAQVGLAHLEEEPAMGQETEGGVHEVAGQGVEDDVYALTG